ncbi:MAG: hypothetical protein QOD41_790 [Cryptosporangiaceae bacterium]|nr:hypothetical protein [Cryptosporangiaceae bacterium]
MRRFATGAVMIALLAATAGCGSDGPAQGTPGLAPRGETMTTAKPSRQDLANTLSLSGTVTMKPVFGIAAPAGGEVRYRDVPASRSTPTSATRVASVWAHGAATAVRVPAGSSFAGRLVADRSTVVTGMPIVSATYSGYGVVAEITGEQAYGVAGSLASVRAQIKNGPGPFGCTVLGTIAALPAGTVPAPAPVAAAPSSAPDHGGGRPVAEPSSAPDGADSPAQAGSEATGLRLVCAPPAGVTLINGASATLQVVTARAVNALVLPVEAVAGLHGQGKVDVLKAGGARETRDVVLGLTDGKVVQIKSGLSGGETVAVPGPDLPAGEPESGAPTGPGGPR